MITVSFNGNGSTPSQQNKSVIFNKKYDVLSVAGERTGHTFNGWFTEEEEKITEGTTVRIGSDHTLYAHWTINNYTITFVFDNGIENEVRVLNYDETIIYPENPTKEGYTFNGWSPKPVRIPSKDVTVTAQWTINNYTITFVFNNGTENDVRVLNYNETIVYPENVVKEGHTFNGWSPKPERMPAENVTVTAQWIEISSLESGSSSIFMSSSVSISSSVSEKSSEKISSESSSSPENATEIVEIVFEKKGMKEGEIKEIVQRFTQEEFIIENFETDEKSGETRVIIKFIDKEKASEFVENANKNKNSNDGIKSIKFSFEKGKSFSRVFLPIAFFILFVA